MPHPLLIGTRGWDHDNWMGGFYPPELPREWRFCLYSNNLRAVLVPHDTWERVAEVDVQRWVEDSDPAFRFVLELPARVCEPAPLRTLSAPLTAFFHIVAPIRAQIAGLLVRVADAVAPEVSWLDGLLTELGASHPLCADLPPAWCTPQARRVLARHGAGLCWRADSEPAPTSGGRLIVALTGEGAARRQRAIVEKLAAVRADDTTVGLFFEGSKAAEYAGQTRLIAEMMGV
jgi:hypothetical protein